jgi:hypothetical protein
MLLEEQAPEEVYASPLVRAVVLAKWHAFARPELRRQACWLALYLALFAAYQVRMPGEPGAAGAFGRECPVVRHPS